MLMLATTRSLDFGLNERLVVKPTSPSQGMRLSLRTALIYGSAVTLYTMVICIYTIHFEAGWQEALSVGPVLALTSGIYFGLMHGGGAYVRHRRLRRLLVRNDLAPRDYVAFLNYAANRVLMQRVGGGYIFLHRLLLDYLAATWIEDVKLGGPEKGLLRNARQWRLS